MTPAAGAPARLGLIVPAAGNSTRMGGGPRKPLIELHGRPILCHALRRFRDVPGIEQVVVVAHPDDLDELRERYWQQLRELGTTDLMAGGGRRQDSVARGVAALGPGIELVLIHDAVRPFVPRRAIGESIRAAAEHGAAIVAMPVPDTVKSVHRDSAAETVPREHLWGAQTPQVFRVALIRGALEAATVDGFEATDDAQLVERLGAEVKVVRGSYANFKITTTEHLRLAEALLAQSDQAGETDG
ncbi:MAG: 2-C-methyl-D-erythritol 4-phosphate cytidylyltransferase [Planctomycetota bacterium]